MGIRALERAAYHGRSSEASLCPGAGHTCLGPCRPTAVVRNAHASGLLCPKVLMLREDGSWVQGTEPSHCQAGLFVSCTCNYGTIHVEVTF